MKSRTYTLLLAGILIVAVLLLLYFALSKNIKPTVGSMSANPLLPIGPAEPGVTWIFVTYNFQAPIKDLVPTTQGMLVTLTTTDKAIPTFLFKNGTQLMAYDKTKNLYYKSSFAPLRRGVMLSVIADYNYSQQSWKVRQAYIK